MVRTRSAPHDRARSACFCCEASALTTRIGMCRVCSPALSSRMIRAELRELLQRGHERRLYQILGVRLAHVGVADAADAGAVPLEQR